MGFVSETLKGLNGIQWYYIIGVLIFVSLFIGVVLHTWAIPKKELNKYKSSIFENDEITNC